MFPRPAQTICVRNPSITCRNAAPNSDGDFLIQVEPTLGKIALWVDGLADYAYRPLRASGKSTPAALASKRKSQIRSPVRYFLRLWM